MNTSEIDFDLIDADRVIDLHAAAIKLKGGLPGLRDRDLLFGAVGNARSAAMYLAEDGQPDALQVAAHLLYYITRAHPFLDGNKRAAWLACEEQLRSIGLTVAAATDEAETLVLQVTTGNCPAPAIVDWIASRITAYEPSFVKT